MLFKQVNDKIKLCFYEVRATQISNLCGFRMRFTVRKKCQRAGFRLPTHRKVVFKPHSDIQGYRSSHKPSQGLVGIQSQISLQVLPGA